MVSSVTEETKEFIIHSNNEAGFVEVSSTSTLSEVRKLIIEEFDTEQLPSQSEEFAFKVNGVRQSQKQEARKNAFELLEVQARVEIIPRVNNDRKRKIDSEDLVGVNDVGSSNDRESGVAKKKLKVDAPCGEVTPFQSSSSSGDSKKSSVDQDKCDDVKGNAAGSGDMSTTGTVDTGTNSSIGPTDLEKKKFSTDNGNEEQISGFDADEMDVENEEDDDKTVVIDKTVDYNGNGQMNDDNHDDDDDITDGAKADESVECDMFYAPSYNEDGDDSHMLLGQPSSTQNCSQTQDADKGSQTHSNDVQNGNDTYMSVESPNDKDTSINASSASSKDTSSAQKLPQVVSYDDDAQNGNDTNMLVESTDTNMPVESTTDNAVKASPNANASSASYDAYIWDISNESNNAHFQVYLGGRGRSKSNLKNLVQKSVKAPYQLQVMTTTSSTRASETRIQQIVTLKSNNMSGDSEEIRVEVYSISNDHLVKDAAWGPYNTFQFGDQYIMAPSFLCASLVQLLYTMFTPPVLDKVQCHCGCERTITNNDEQWLRIEDRMKDYVCFEKIPHFSQWLSYRGHYAYIIDWVGYRILANTFVRYGIQDKLAFSTLLPPMPFRPINNLSDFFKDSKELHNDNRRCDTNHTLVWYAGFVRRSVALRPKNDGHVHLPENLVLPFLGEGWKDADFIANNLASVWKTGRGEGLPNDEDQWKKAVVTSREGNVPIGERCNKDYHGKNAYLPITFDGAVTTLKDLTTDIDWD